MSRTYKSGRLWWKEKTSYRRRSTRKYRQMCRQLLREGKVEFPIFKGTEGWLTA